MKKGIMIDARGDSNWIGGLYYRKNIAFQISLNEYIKENYDIYVYTYEEVRNIFNDLPSCIKVICPKASKGLGEILNRLYLCIKYKIKCVYPSAQSTLKSIGVIPISWIADFQHNRLPEMFTEEEISARTSRYSKIASAQYPLVLSSQSAKDDFKTFYENKENVYVVPFVSYIENDILNISAEEEQEILIRYDLDNKKYVYIANQFWKHKNHIVALKAIDIFFKKNTDAQVVFVFTGKMQDYRNPDYIDSITCLFEKQSTQNRVMNLGFLDRAEQLVVMKNCEYVIQPSLFEGWGTVLEDCKVLDKTVLLSNIPVHQEQKNEKCTLFDPYDESELAELIELENNKVHTDNIENGIRNMYLNAKKYSQSFEMLLKNL